jgi:hypothetical protein
LVFTLEEQADTSTFFSFVTSLVTEAGAEQEPEEQEPPRLNRSAGSAAIIATETKTEIITDSLKTTGVNTTP